MNSLTHFLLRKDYFPLALILSLIGGEGMRRKTFGKHDNSSFFV